MSVARVFLAAVCLLGGGMACVSAGESPDDPGQRIDIAHDPEFPRASRVLDRLVKRDKMGGNANRFCIVGYRHGLEKIAWVYWPNRHALILWEPQTAPVADLSISRRQLDLNRDVVASEADVRGSTYRVTRRWVDHVIGDCEAFGLKISIP